MAGHEGGRAIALVSGGLDSVVSLARAAREMNVRLVLFFNYRQRALDRERHAVLGTVNFYGLPFAEVELGWYESLSPEGMRFAPGSGAGGPELDTLDAVWVPNRNGVFLNVAAAFAEKYDCGYVVTGFNREEAVEFPDNRPEYVNRLNGALEFSTRNAVKVMSFTQELDKAEILKMGAELGAPLSTIWSCYHNRALMCGRCASCRKLRAALDSLPADSKPVIRFER